MPTSPEDKTRVCFDFTPAALTALDDLVERTGAPSRAEVVRRALALYDRAESTAEKCHPDQGTTCAWLPQITTLSGERAPLVWGNYADMSTGKRTVDRLILNRRQKDGGPVRLTFCPCCGADVSRGFAVKVVDRG